MRIKFGIFAFTVFAAAATASAQDIEQAKKAIDAEQFEKAKAMLKSIVKNKPSDGMATFLLGNVYLNQNLEDSAKVFYQKGLAASDNANYNYIGLGHIDVINGNLSNASTNFGLATKDMRRKDYMEYIYISKAYMDGNNPSAKNALIPLGRAKMIAPADPNLLLAFGDAYLGDKNPNESYKSYREAYQADNTMLRAKMQLGVLLKSAKAFGEAIKSFNEVIAINATYGPVYRELAETYYFWALSERRKYDEYIQLALTNYEKYMSLTDYSLSSRMRHADFLILAGDYKALEVEAEQMKKIDKVNPRILRYLGYSAYENGNPDVAIKSINDFVTNTRNKPIARDYMYLGFAKLKKASTMDTTKVDVPTFNSGITDIKKSIEMEPTMAGDLSEMGKKLYAQKFFNEAAAVYELAVTNKESNSYLLDNFYLGNAIYFGSARGSSDKPNMVQLAKADKAYGEVIIGSPDTQDAYLYRARTNRLMGNEEMIIKYYQQYLAVINEKGAPEIQKNKAKVIEAYNNIASSYANSDKMKAKEFFNKTLALDPENQFATDALKQLK